MNNNTQNIETNSVKKVGRPSKLHFPETGTFKVADLVKKSGVTAAAVHVRLKKMLENGTARLVSKDDNVRGRKAGVYSLEAEDKNQ